MAKSICDGCEWARKVAYLRKPKPTDELFVPVACRNCARKHARRVKRLRDFVEELATAEEVPYDEECHAWHNAGDVYDHGYECAMSSIGKKARAALLDKED